MKAYHGNVAAFKPKLDTSLNFLKFLRNFFVNTRFEKMSSFFNVFEENALNIKRKIVTFDKLAIFLNPYVYVRVDKKRADLKRAAHK